MESAAILTRNNLKGLEKGQPVSINAKAGDNLTATIKIVPAKGQCIIKVDLLTDNPKKHTGMKRQRTVSDINILDASISNSIRILVGKYEKKFAKKNQSKGRGNLLDFKDRVNAVPGVLEPSSYGIRRSTKKYYAVSTIDSAVSYLTDTIGKMFADAGSFDLSEDQMMDFFNSEVERIYNQNNKHAKSLQTKESIAAGLGSRWRTANEVLEYCRITSPELGPWPVRNLPMIQSNRTSSPELIKVLPYSRYIKAATLIIKACKLEIPEAFASCGILFCAMRVGESSALRISCFEFNGDLGRYYIHEQVGKDGQITDRLKNIYSYRYAYIYGIMRDMYDLRVWQLKCKGYSDEEIKKAFFSSEPDNINAPIKKEKVSSFLKKIFILAGCKREEIKTIETELVGDIGYDCDNDFGAHVGRKNLSSYAANGGMSVLMVDALLGHENKENKDIDYAGWDNAEKAIKILSRCLYFGSLTNTINPAYKPVDLDNVVYILKGNHEYNFITLKDGYFNASLNTLESNDSILITTPNEVTLNPDPDYTIDTSEDKMNRTVISSIPPIEDIETWIKEAEEIDITSLIHFNLEDNEDE